MAEQAGAALMEFAQQPAAATVFEPPNPNLTLTLTLILILRLTRRGSTSPYISLYLPISPRRGLDISSVQTVINNDLPTEMKTYVHRVGPP